YLLAQEYLSHRLAAQGRRALSRVSIQCGEADLRQQPGARVVFCELIRCPAMFGRDWHVVDRPQYAIHEDPAGGEQVTIIILVGDQQVDDGAQRLFLRVRGDGRIEGGIDHRVLRQGLEPVEGQHVGEEGTDTGLEPWR